MAKGKTRALIILTGVACLVIAGWFALDRFSQKEESADSNPTVIINHSRSSLSGGERDSSPPRPLEELNQILAAARDEWGHLADTRYFFEDYADEVVTQFSLEEIRLLGIERMGHDFRNVVGFQYAIMRRWGELDMEGAVNHVSKQLRYYRLASSKAFYLKRQSERESLDEEGGLLDYTLGEEAAAVELFTYSKEEMKALERLQLREDGRGSTTDYLRTFHRMLYEELSIGEARINPKEFISRRISWMRDLKEKGEFDYRYWSDFRKLEEALKCLTEQDPQAASSLLKDHERLVNFSVREKETENNKESEEVAPGPLVSGYFRGLPEGSNWLEIFNSLDTDFQEDSYVPMLARWMEDDAAAALDWSLSSIPPDRFFNEGEDDPFSSLVLESLEPMPVDAHARALGGAVSYWLQRDPNRASAWITENVQNLSPDFFCGPLIEMSMADSPSGFLKVFENIREIADIQERGQTLLKFENDMNFFSNWYPDRYQWRQEERILEALKEIKVAPNHQADVSMIIERAEKSIREQSQVDTE